MKHNALFLFDIDGTIVRTNGAGMRSYKRAFRRVFFSDDAVLDDSVDFAGKTDRVIFDDLARRNGVAVPAGAWSEFLGEYAALLSAEAADISGWEICPSVPAVIRLLAERAYLGLLTGNAAVGAQIKLSAVGLDGYFPVGGLADDGYSREEVAEAALKKSVQHYGVQFPLSSVYVIGDTVHDVRCARHIGARAVAVATGGPSLAELSAEKPDMALADLSAFAVDSILPQQR